MRSFGTGQRRKCSALLTSNICTIVLVYIYIEDVFKKSGHHHIVILPILFMSCMNE